jgi:hypothetical protein
VLSFVQSPASIQQQRAEGAAAFARAMATDRAAPRGSGPSGQRSGPWSAAAPEPPPVAWPLALGALTLLGVATLALRRRQRF